jgi:hypothetical protein
MEVKENMKLNEQQKQEKRSFEVSMHIDKNKSSQHSSVT